MFNFIRTLIESKTESQSGDVVDQMDASIASKGSVKFTNDRMTINSQDDVSATDVADYLQNAQSVNDGVECVGFAVELDDGKMVKIYVAKNDATKFEDVLALALGGQEEFEDVLLRLANEFDVVDVIWPTDDYGTQTVEQDSAEVDTSQDKTKVNLDIKSELTQEVPVDPDQESSEPEGDISSAIKDFDDLYKDSDATDGESESEESEPESTEKESESEESTEKESESEESEESESEESEESESEESEESESEPESAEKKSDSDESDEDEDEDGDEGVSVIIHTKKKMSESMVVPPKYVENAKKGTSDLFHAFGLDSQYSIVGSKLDSLIAKRILVIVGVIGIPGSYLDKFTNLEDSISVAADRISAGGVLRTHFNIIFNKIISTDHREKYTDVQYRGDFRKFMNVLGVNLDIIGNTRQGMSAILFGAHCVSDSEVRTSMEAFMTEFGWNDQKNTVNEQIINSDAKDDRSPEQLSHIMMRQHSGYRTWMDIGKQRELWDWYKSGSQVHVDFFHEGDASWSDNLPKNRQLFAQSSVDEDGLYEVISLSVPTAIIRK